MGDNKQFKQLLLAVVDAPFSGRAKSERKIARLIVERGSQLQKRGLSKAEAQKQAVAELTQFFEMLNLDLDSMRDLVFAEGNFPLFTRSLDFVASNRK